MSREYFRLFHNKIGESAEKVFGVYLDRRQVKSMHILTPDIVIFFFFID